MIDVKPRFAPRRTIKASPPAREGPHRYAAPSAADDAHPVRHDQPRLSTSTTMKLPLEISIQGMPRSAALEEAIARHAAKLERYCAEIIRCRVSVILDDKHKHQGKPFDVHVDVTIPGREIVSNRESDEDVYVALRDAFGNAERMLDDAASKRRDQTRRSA
ncbi:ribosomal subunit interface protein [Burkholderia pseudomallei 1106b]|nr:RedA [Burkholderia pseudomallei 1710b]EES23836.1 ribosomal subunit interface protein [Burkholderia pseudomallei 1106b]EET10181.1 ribosomal subunit interface protein [Burkholderia pseudomallei 1710a]